MKYNDLCRNLLELLEVRIALCVDVITVLWEVFKWWLVPLGIHPLQMGASCRFLTACLHRM